MLIREIFRNLHQTLTSKSIKYTSFQLLQLMPNVSRWLIGAVYVADPELVRLVCEVIQSKVRDHMISTYIDGCLYHRYTVGTPWPS